MSYSSPQSGSFGIQTEHGAKKFDRKEFQTTYIMQHTDKKYGDRYRDVIDSVMYLMHKWEGARRELEQDWEECWAHYLSNYRGNQILDRQTVINVGDVSNDYRHKITTSKAYELVETANAYLQGAFFPSKMWFYMLPKNPMNNQDWEDDLDVMNHYILNKLEEANVRNVWDKFCRQALVVGTSVLAMPWLYDTRMTYKKQKNPKSGKFEVMPIERIQYNNLKLEVLDMMDVYLDPSKTDPRDSGLLRRMVMKKGEVIRMINSDLYPLGDVKEIQRIPAYSRAGTQSEERQENLRWVEGLGTGEHQADDDIAVYEYWGDLVIDDCEFLDVHVVFTEQVLLVFEPNPFWGGRPFVVGTLVDGHESPYGIGLIQPVQGLLHQMYLTQNHRLDCDDFVVDPMFLVKSDGSVNLQDVYAEPGKIIPVEDPESDIKQIDLNASNVSVQIQDESLLETRVNQATGVGEYINTQGRDAERVTAREVEARQNAGGNRLGRFHKHLEDTALKHFLNLSYAYLQQFVQGSDTVRIQKPSKEGIKDNYEYYSVGEEDLSVDMDLIPIGADHVVDKETELRERIDFYTFVQQLPQAAQYVNWKEVIKDLARRLIKDDWSKYVVLPQEQNGFPVDPGTGQSHVDMMANMEKAKGQPQQQELPPELMAMLQGGGGQAAPPQGESYDMQQMEAMLQQNPQLTEKAVSQNVQDAKQIYTQE